MKSSVSNAITSSASPSSASTPRLVASCYSSSITAGDTLPTLSGPSSASARSLIASCASSTASSLVSRSRMVATPRSACHPCPFRSSCRAPFAPGGAPVWPGHGQAPHRLLHRLLPAHNKNALRGSYVSYNSHVLLYVTCATLFRGSLGWPTMGNPPMPISRRLPSMTIRWTHALVPEGRITRWRPPRLHNAQGPLEPSP